MSRKIFIKDNIEKLFEKIERALQKANSPQRKVKVVAISKTFPASDIYYAYECGISDFGENYVQEACKKMKELADAGIVWHFVGRIQSNKAKLITQNFEYIQSISSIEKLKLLEKFAQDHNRIVKGLIQVNIGRERTKDGVDPAEVINFYHEILKINPKWVQIQGLMIIPPPSEAPRRYFAELRKIRDSCIEKGIPENMVRELSMGMSDDFEIAIEEGATIIRIGRFIFGERPLKQNP